MEQKAFTFNPDHKLLFHPGGGGDKGFKPTHRLFLQGSPIPTRQEMEKTALLCERIKNMTFPFPFVPLAGEEV